jgi:hypothetical protein
MKQAIIYTPEGKVHSVLDPMGDFELPEDPIALRKLVNPPDGHGVLLYEKLRDQAKRVQLGSGWHELYDWQTAVDKHIGKV